MDHLEELAASLTAVLDQLQVEAQERNLRNLMVPLAWLDEASGWLDLELQRLKRPADDAVPFTYIPVDLRR